MVKTPSQRTTEWRAALVAQGYRQKAFLLSPAALAALDELALIHGTARDALEAVLIAANPSPPDRP
jgi:hypothetical protein